MNYADLIGHFVSPSSAAKALGVDRRLVDVWKKRRIPSRHQLKAEHISEGKLQADAQAKEDAKEFASFMPASPTEHKAEA